MLLKFCKTKHSYFFVFVPLICLALWSKALFSYQWFTVFDNAPMPLYHFVIDIVGNTNLLAISLAIFLQVCEAFLILRLCNKYNFLSERSVLPAIIFVLVSSSISSIHYLHPSWFANLFLLIAIDLIMGFYNNPESISNSLEAAFFISVGSLFDFALTGFIVFLWYGLVIMRTFSWREWAVSLVGFCIPYFLLLAFYYFFTGSLEQIFSTIQTNGIQNGKYIWSFFGKSHFIFYSFLVILLLFAIQGLNFQKLKIANRIFFGALIVLLIVSATLFFVFSPDAIEHIVFFSVPVSILLANYFIVLPYKVFGEILYTIFVLLLTIVMIAN